MKLKYYLRTNRINQAQFAKQCGLSEASISRIISGERQPSLKVMQIIFVASNGKVTANDFFKD